MGHRLFFLYREQDGHRGTRGGWESPSRGPEDTAFPEEETGTNGHFWPGPWRFSPRGL